MTLQLLAKTLKLFGMLFHLTVICFCYYVQLVRVGVFQHKALSFIRTLRK